MSHLIDQVARLVDVPSVSYHEAAIADLLEAELRGTGRFEVTRVEDNLVARTALGRDRRAILAGHLDTVPPAGNARARIEGTRLYGLGAADMKGGLAVMLEIAAMLEDPSVDLSLVFYACEEVRRADSGLEALAKLRPDLLVGDVAVLLEPTSGRVEAGCQGIVRIDVVVRGHRAHSARPWTGTNAIHRLGRVLELVASFPERRPVIEGCEFRETLQAVAVSGGVAGNVVPDEARLTLSLRFAPDRDADEARAVLEELLASALEDALGDEIELVDAAPAALPGLDDPLLAGLVQASGAPPTAKLGFTDVAFFAQRGIPAANFGPGDPLLAHRREEFVESDELDRVGATLARLLGSD